MAFSSHFKPKHTLSNSGAGTAHLENPARFAVGHYDSLVRISTWQRRSDSDHDRWTLKPHSVGSWRRRRKSASRVQSGYWGGALHRASTADDRFTSLPDADCN